MNKLVFWIAILAMTLAFSYAISDVLIPFAISFVFAYLLQPVIERISFYFKVSRTSISVVIFLVFISAFVIAVLTLAPIIYSQMAAFIHKIPKYKLYFDQLAEISTERLQSFDAETANRVSEAITGVGNAMFSIVGSMANHLWDYTVATINLFAIIALVPIILFYFMRDWPRIVETVNSLIPEQERSKIRSIFTSINSLLAAYIRGQLNICFILAIYYVVGLSVIGVDLAVLLGILSGFLIIIPFIGAFTSFLLALISCYMSFGFGHQLAYLLLLYGVGHGIEGYILAPKVIGNKIGLHPLWIIFSVFAAGALFGFIGILFAIPLAGITKVLITHCIEYYKTTKYYKGE